MVRLGMSGKLLVADKSDAREKHTHVVVPLGDGARELRYVDPRRFGEVVPFKKRAQLDEEKARLGPDPLSFADDDIAWAVGKLKATKRSLKDAVLDQRLFAGVGNIYACEALYLAKLSPELRGVDVSKPRLTKLVHELANVLTSAVAHRGTTFSDFVDGQGGYGENQSYLHVFQREGEPCGVCGKKIERIVQGGRSTFLCRRCQPKRR
jgi:formamidopyrimidine-DNA glycosylase